MWNYNKQITVRWVSFILFAVLLAGTLALLSSGHQEGLGQAELKTLTTQISVTAELLPVYVWFFVFLALVMLLLLGVPSILIFAPTYVVAGFLLAFVVTVIAQIHASIIAVYLARRKGWTEKLPQPVRSSIEESEAGVASLSFWARVYLSYPLRTVDLVVGHMLGEDKPAGAVYPSIFIASTIRTLIPAIWSSSLIDLITNFSYNPAADSSWFLIWSSILVAYIVLPRIPELIICKKAVKPVLLQIEAWETSLKPKKVARPGKGRNKVKLGVESGPG
jgi:hypothetical protein